MEEKTFKIRLGELRRLVRESIERMLSEAKLDPRMERLVSYLRKVDNVTATKVNLFFNRVVTNRIEEYEREQMAEDIRALLSKLPKDGRKVAAYFDSILKSHLENDQSYHRINDLISSTLNPPKQDKELTFKSIGGSGAGPTKPGQSLSFKSLR